MLIPEESNARRIDFIELVLIFVFKNLIVVFVLVVLVLLILIIVLIFLVLEVLILLILFVICHENHPTFYGYYL